MGIRTAGFYSLFAGFNKKKNKGGDEDVQEGLIESLGELTLDKSDEELIDLTKSWDLLYSGSSVKARIHNEGDICERYWIGKQHPDTEYENGKRPLTDNVIFPNFETMLARATQQNPEPIVITDNGEVTPAQPPSIENPAGKPALMMSDVGDKIHMSLEYLARENNLKNVLKKGTRYWGIRFLGAWQTLWDGEKEEITTRALNPKDLILDPNAYIENTEYHGEFIGIKLTDSARNLITRFPQAKEKITQEAKGKLGSLMGYVQWRTDEFVVYTMKNFVLFKHKNENWNYEKDTISIDELGQPQTQKQPGQNHWKRPKLAMKFLTVYDLGDEPADRTSLIQQALVTQDNINKRLKQIDRNTDNINGGVIVSGLAFNKEQAAQVAEARRQGRTIVVPTGNISEAIQMPQNPALPEALYASLSDARNQVAQRMGTFGSTPAGTTQEQTVRGKIIAGDQDESRTGGGVTAALEVAAAGIFDDMLQLIYVFWDVPHKVSVLGPDNAETFIEFQASEIPQDRQIVIAVQDGSLVPQDDLSNYNEAMAEWEGGVSDPLSYYEKVKDPAPLERAQKLMIFKTNPALYMQQFLQVAPPQAPAPIPEGGGGSESGAPPSSITPNQAVPSPVQAQESSLIKQVPIQ